MPGTNVVKVVFMGDAGVGKSTIFARLVSGSVPQHYESTIGAAFNRLHLVRDRGTGRLSRMDSRYQLELQASDEEYWTVEAWDTAGQERYASLTPMYYRSAHAIIIVHDDNPATRRRAERLLGEVRRDARRNSDALVCVWQNKSDVGERASAWHARLEDQGVPTAFVSATTGDRVEAAFFQVVRRAIDRVKDLRDSALHDSQARDDTIHLGRASPGGPCCAGTWPLGK